LAKQGEETGGGSGGGRLTRGRIQKSRVEQMMEKAIEERNTQRRLHPMAQRQKAEPWASHIQEEMAPSSTKVDPYH